jgi:general secretion pathway protein C
MISLRTLLTTSQLGLLAVAALLSASTVNAWVAGRFRDPPQLISAPPPDVAPTARRPLAYYQPITAKDFFNPPRSADPDPQSQASELKAKLLGTAPGAGMTSFAIIESDTDKIQQLYRVGDKLENRTLTSVEWGRVTLRSERGEEVLRIVEPSGMPGQAPAPSGPSVGGVLQRSDTDFVVERGEIDKAMENLNQLFTQMRAVPHFQDGKAAGFRLFAIKQDSVFEKLGLKNGDVISRINGNDLTDPARAMSLIQELRAEGRITVDVNRNRQPTTLTYEIR